MKTLFTKVSKSTIRLLLFAALWLTCATEVSANYYYRLKLLDTDTNEIFQWDNGTEWSGWIYANKYNDHWWHSLRDYIENIQEVREDNDGQAVPCRYKNASYGETKWCDDADESGFDIKYKVVGIGFKGTNSEGEHGEWFEILDGDDYFYMKDGEQIEIFNRIKDEVLELDLSEWQKAFLGTQRTELHYFGEMVAMTTLRLPTEHEFAIGDEYLFANAYNLENIVWGTNSKIVEVGKGAFRDCFKLPQTIIQRIINEVGMYSSEGAIGSEAFYNCLQLQEVTIPARIRWIGDEAFCQRVEIPQLPSGYDTSILKPSLKKVTFLSDATKTGSNEYKKSYWDNYEQHLSDDFKWSGLQIDYLGNMCFAECQLLEDVVLNEAQLKSLGYGVFADCRLLSSSKVQAILDNFSQYGQDGDGNIQIPAALFWGVNGKKQDGTYDKRFTTLTIPANVSSIGAAAFGVDALNDEPSIKTINVSRGWRPDCLSRFDDKPDYDRLTSFAGIVPNHVTINFSGDAAKYSSSTSSLVGYTHYQNDGSEWQRLLTKDIYSGTTVADYDVEPQQHAIVRLHRTMNAGWNTMCLPFGATAAAKEVPEKVEGEPSANSRIIQSALNSSNSTDFMLAVYRDFVSGADNFRCLQLSDYDNQALEAYVPFMVKMASDDIAGDGIYTFKNVDVNYKWTKSGDTWSSTITEPGSMAAQPFAGQSESFAPFNDGKGSTSDYQFTGTFETMIGTVGSSDAINSKITTRDYYVQNQSGAARCFQYESGKKVGIKAFTGWFHYTGSGNARPVSILMSVAAADADMPTSVMRITDEGIDEHCGPVYNAQGQKVLPSAQGIGSLQKGMYIVGGKKILVK